MRPAVVVIGMGNAYRRDDGVGLAVADEIAKQAPPGVAVRSGVRDPTELLDVWAGADLAIIVDATPSRSGQPGRVRRMTPDALAETRTTSSHGVDLLAALALAETLRRNPSRAVLYTVDVEDCAHGLGLTPTVAATVPDVAAAIVAEAAAAAARATQPGACDTARPPR